MFFNFLLPHPSVSLKGLWPHWNADNTKLRDIAINGETVMDLFLNWYTQKCRDTNYT